VATFQVEGVMSASASRAGIEYGDRVSVRMLFV
jgi:hypothetical protein